MLKFLALLLSCLLLCGCGRQEPPADPAGQPPASVQVPQSTPALGEMEARYDGALEIYSLNLPQVTGVRSMGNSLVVFSGGETTTLTLLGGKTLTEEASVQLDCALDPHAPSLRLGEDWLSYYDPVRKLTIVLDASLGEITHLAAPEGLQGEPILSDDHSVLYYCTQDAIRVWELTSGFHRQIKEMAFPGQRLANLILDGTVLQCQIPEETQERTILVSAQTGQLLYSRNSPLLMTSRYGRYCLSLPSGLGQTLLCGEIGTDPRLFLPADPSGDCVFLERQAGAVTIAPNSDGGQRLDYYSLSSGKRLSTLTLDAAYAPAAIGDTADGILTILTQNPQDGTYALCRWDTSPTNALGVSDEGNYLFPYSTAENPGHNAWAQCQAYAAELGEKYGIQILIGDDAVRVQPWDYDLLPETQPGVLMRELELLDERLSQFPSNILPDTSAHFSSLKLCIVRQLTGTAESGSLEQATGAQFFSGTEAYVVIASGRYSEQALYHELFHAMQTHILTDSIAFDQWDKLNPQEFSYSYHPLPGQENADTYLTGENRAFIDAYAMTFPKEDQARILEYAMLPGNRDMFQAWILQRKLIAVCEGIREAYGLKKSPDIYPWEQYLHTPLAYQK